MLSRTISSVASSRRAWAGDSPLAIAEDELGGRDGHLDQRLADGGQRRPDPLRDRQVVEAHHAQVLGDVEPRLAGGLVDAQGLEVVAGEDRRRAVGEREQRPAAVDPLLDVELAVADQLRIDRHARLVHRRAIAVEPGPAAQDPARPADHADPPVPEAQQVAGRGQAAVPVGGADRRRVVERLAGRVDDDERDAARPELHPHGLAEVREHRDHPGRAAGEHPLDPAPARPPPALHLGQDDRQLVLPGDLLDAPDDLQRPLALEFVEDDLQQRRPTGRAHGPLVAMLPDRRLDAPARLRRHVRPAVDHLRHGRHRHPRQLRDVRDRRRTRPAPGGGRARDHHPHSIPKLSGGESANPTRSSAHDRCAGAPGGRPDRRA